MWRHLSFSSLLKYPLFVFMCLGMAFLAYGQEESEPLYKQATVPVDQRVEDLLGRMTLEEKVGQLSTLLGWKMYEKRDDHVKVSKAFEEAVQQQHIGMLWATLRADPWTQKTLVTGLNPKQAAEATNAMQKYVLENTRLGIPMMLAEECPHGHMAIGTTVFPTSIGQASTWNPALIQEMAAAIALEARLQGGHIGYGPVLDLAREPRWSRVEETYGEDPYINSQMGRAMVSGFQGESIASGKNVISTLKHFTAYGVPEGGHNGTSVSVGQRELHESYLPPFKAAVAEGALSVMTAYNSIDGVPCTSNGHLLNDVLRDDWGFNGFVVSDLGSISGLRGSHHVTETAEGAAQLAINAGVDSDLGGYGFGKNLLAAVQAGGVSQEVLDEAVRRVLKVKFDMGLFENPYVDPSKAESLVRSAKHIALARKVARESVVLLKNENDLLPLRKKVNSIAVIGPNADNTYNQLGDYTAPQPNENVVTVLEGIKNKVGKDVRVNYVKGCAIRDTTQSEIGKAASLAARSDVAVVVLGGSSARDFDTEYEETAAAKVSEAEEGQVISDMESGEGFDRMTLDLLGDQLKLVQAVQATGTPVVVVLIKGRPLNLNWIDEHVPAIVDAWYPGQEGGNAIADVLFGDYNPSGRLTISVPRSVGQLPVFYNYRNPKRHDYVEGSAEPLYAFGHGLSYADFEYDNLEVTASGMAGSPTVRVHFQVSNISNVDGEEVVQLYVRDEAGSTVRPLLELKRFEKVMVPAGESSKITFMLTAEDLQVLGQDMNWLVEPGSFQVLVGRSSRDIRLEGKFILE
ncbi:glycoside hydrolase family 3 N-terminal domain-containing protein [Echinicola vietnamensis]|uniref:Beta-glucosidase-like glycosyl hydrolase n=1 Tax=Echinicola vietnamensis (strain DSM 17526 / LMG 23754 / KMM 6221) TaxID=926556 RepID=L0FXM6_ECHVK|nr:glycoside hydrolase family 3 N-terminal domain-containing protein [Echinicola vietnamensis]AGA78659.1 beta-glucosidase-like glycosyl hydrolase [Echinicola vietnamensis DSM 17526]